MNAERHGIVHEVVRGGDGVEYILDKRFLLFLRNGLETEVSGVFGLLLVRRRGLTMAKPEGAVKISATCSPSDVAGEHGQASGDRSACATNRKE